MMAYDVVVIGAGPAGMAAALSARQYGAGRVLIIERNNHLGGILNQCIHDGFGLVKFGEVLTGPEYAYKYISLIRDSDIEVCLNAMVTEIMPDKRVTYVTHEGLSVVQVGAIIIATGCRERTRGMLAIPGTRPAGIYTAGVVQRLINVQNIMPGKRAVILGSGDVGLIMARRMVLEGMDVVCVLEKLTHLSGLLRNKNQCLDDFDIPLYLNHTVVEVQGNPHLERVIVAKVDENGEVITDSEYTIECDTLVLSTGLIPENELANACGILIDDGSGGPIVTDKFETSIQGIFSCGNSLHVNALADYASEEGEQAGRYAAEYVGNGVAL